MKTDSQTPFCCPAITYPNKYDQHFGKMQFCYFCIVSIGSISIKWFANYLLNSRNFLPKAICKRYGTFKWMDGDVNSLLDWISLSWHWSIAEPRWIYNI